MGNLTGQNQMTSLISGYKFLVHNAELEWTDYKFVIFWSCLFGFLTALVGIKALSWSGFPLFLLMGQAVIIEACYRNCKRRGLLK